MLTVLFITVVVLVVGNLWKISKYWRNRGVPSDTFFGYLSSICQGFMRKNSIGDAVLIIYNKYPDWRYSGIFQITNPLLIIRDPDLIKQITVKDFEHFTDHRQMFDETVEPLWGKGLFQLSGDRWRDMRGTLSPAFTSSKMKSMFVLISDCAQQFAQYFLAKGEETIELEMKDAVTRYANDVIASTAFGVKCDSLRDRDNEFYRMGGGFGTLSTLNFLRIMLFFVSPRIFKFVGGSIFDKKITVFFRKLVKETLEYRTRENVVRPDMIHLLMEARKGRLKHEESSGSNKDTGFATVEESSVGQQSKKKELTDEDITAQAMLFFIAGFDSVSNLMSFLSYELALNADVQEKLRQEVDETLEECPKGLTYEALTKMKYMDMVVSETLRKWPSAVAVDRECTKPYVIEPQDPKELPVKLEKGDMIWLPIFGLQRDPVFFPDPDKFDPERFSDENKHNIHPFSYIPFGAGPRNCIGSRFALLEVKALMFHVLAKFELITNEKTQIPVKLSKKHFNMAAEDGIKLSFKRRIL